MQATGGQDKPMGWSPYQVHLWWEGSKEKRFLGCLT